MHNNLAAASHTDATLSDRVADLLARMNLVEKIGQMCQVNVGEGHIPANIAEDIRAGWVGSVLNEVDPARVAELQRIAKTESRLGIPLMIGRDVIHGFSTVMPIPFAQAASWNPQLVEAGARVAATEAAERGINWTFAPMVDVARDPRWGRIAESFGEDPTLCAVLGAASVRGYQGAALNEPYAIASCAKHFAGYGAAESGRDYATTNVPENELRNVHLKPFKAAIDAGVTTIMTSFSDIDGIPASANHFLLRKVLREEWNFPGFVVSDWDSIRQLAIHGLTANDRESGREALQAGVDMEMHGDAYRGHLESLLESDEIDSDHIDDAVARILRIKFELGLFDEEPGSAPPRTTDHVDPLQVAEQAALESVVLLKNTNDALPLDTERLTSIAIIGPLADAPRDQLGTWIFDGDPSLSQTPLASLQATLGESVRIDFVRTLETSRSQATTDFGDAWHAVSRADVTLLFLGEEAILSGEAHSRADIGLPGAQVELIHHLRATGKPLIGVVMAGRPLVLTPVIDDLSALLFAGHLGTMTGPALTRILCGETSPMGKLPATLPRMVGQIPIYHSQKNTGKPPHPDGVVMIDEIDPQADQLSTGMTAYHLDAGYTPLFPFGYGLSYAAFRYGNLLLSAESITTAESLTISVDLSNNGDYGAHEIAQLYIRDLVGSTTRPVRELKQFQRIYLEPGETRQLTFTLDAKDLEFYGRSNTLTVEPGEFHVWVGGDSNAELGSSFFVTA